MREAMGVTMIERVALRLFWKAEHLDPSSESDVPESEYGEGWPESMTERRREFWRLLARAAIEAMRDPVYREECACSSDWSNPDHPRITICGKHMGEISIPPITV